MAEEAEGQDVGGEAGLGIDPAAVALALGSASRNTADRFLEEQTVLARDQRHHLDEQLKRVKTGVISDRLSVTLKMLTVLAGLGIAGFFGLMVWDAAHSSGLIIEPFAVPSAMAANGLSGQVVAGQMLDRLTAMQDATDSGRSAQSYANNWGDDIKVEIPETGVSIGELQSFLKSWLGHDTHITGEIWRTHTGIALTAREGAEPGVTFTGAEDDLDALIQKAAEHIYSVTQPYRYANFIFYRNDGSAFADRFARAAAIYRRLIAGPNARERAWAWSGLATMESFIDLRHADFDYRESVAAAPDFTLGYFGLSFEELPLGRYEDTLSATLKAKNLLDRSDVPDVNPDQVPLRRLRNDGYLALAKGDFGEALRDFKAGASTPQDFANLPRVQYSAAALQALAYLHDGTGMRGYLRDLVISSIETHYGRGEALFVARGLEDWQTVLRLEHPVPGSVPEQSWLAASPLRQSAITLAHANTGDVKGAEARVAQCPTGSDDCLMARGRIADLEGQHDSADSWFARAAGREPSVPFADTAWGQSLLARGQLDAAIEKFQQANQKGPHFADPLEGWGEALMAKNRSDLALTKFEEANKYAPNWGRLHLKWGEALTYAGKPADAKTQFARAATLDLTPADKVELAWQQHKREAT